MLDIILVGLLIVGLLLLIWFFSVYCLPGIRRLRDRQTDENITASEDICDCFLESRKNLIASKTCGRLERKAGFSRKLKDYLPLLTPEIQSYLNREPSRSLRRESKVADYDLQLQFCNLSRQPDHILTTQKPLETDQYTEEKLSRASVGLDASVGIPNRIKTDLF